MKAANPVSARLDAKFEIFKSPVAVYEGRAVLRFNLTVPATTADRLGEIKGRLKFQACNDDACFPPITREVKMWLNVEGGPGKTKYKERYVAWPTTAINLPTLPFTLFLGDTKRTGRYGTWYRSARYEFVPRPRRIPLVACDWL